MGSGPPTEVVTAESVVRSPAPLTGPAVLFVGPSLAPADRARIPAGIDVRAPIARGDLPAVVDAGTRTVGIIDGEFFQRLAVSPREILLALEAGCWIGGGASMGALRAAELHRRGMVGVGRIFEWFRDGVLTRDDDVAVSYAHDEDDYRLLTVPWVNVKWVMYLAGTAGWLDAGARRRVAAAARALHWERRTWPLVCQRAPLSVDQTARVLRCARDPANDCKRLDALATVAVLAHRVRAGQHREFARQTGGHR